jgi:type I restriction enzyme S subunit
VSRIDELISELVPTGIRFKAVAEVTSKSSNIRWASVGDDRFQYIDLTSVDRLTRKVGDTATISAEDAPSRAQQIVRAGDVIFATTRPAQMRWTVIPPELDGQIASTGYCVLRPDNSQVLTNYLAHLLGTDSFRQYVEANQVAGNYPSIPDSRVRSYRIPLPPLEVQREIVRILDHFTELEVQLEAELEARSRQYGSYRDRLTSFPEAARVRRIPMGELATIVRGASPRPIQAFVTGDANGVPWIKIGDVTAGGKYITSTAERITPAGAAKSRRVYPGDFVLSNSMSFGRPYISKIEGCIHDGWLSISHFEESFLPDFLYHLLRSADVQSDFARNVGTSSVSNLNSEIVKSIVLPVPPLDEQSRVVEILDKFNTLVNDMSSGLPAEINARRTQYEYYRDRLLTFEEASA